MTRALPRARRAALPLSSDSKGKDVALHLLLCGTAQIPRGSLLGPSGRSGVLGALGLGFGSERLIEVPIIAFLVEHPSARPILIDAGLDPSIAQHGPRADFGWLSTLVFRNLQMDPDQALRVQIQRRGVDPEAVSHILMTHLHTDHASGLSQFPGTTALIGKREWENFGGPSSGYQSSHLDGSLDYRLLDFDSDGIAESGLPR